MYILTPILVNHPPCYLTGLDLAQSSMVASATPWVRYLCFLKIPHENMPFSALPSTAVRPKPDPVTLYASNWQVDRVPDLEAIKGLELATIL